MVRNIRGHRIRWGVLAAQGARVGIWSALAMLVVAMLTVPLFSSGLDSWSFTKIIAAYFMGDSAASPVTGLDAGPVLVGTCIHLAIGALVGVSFAAIIGMFDLEGWTPVALVGLMYGALLFVGSATVIAAGVGPADTYDLPMAPLLWGNVIFGLVAGVLMAAWADAADLDQPEEERVRVFETTGAPSDSR